ncbi:MAG TPA: 1-acyl-sn-glycerol-3-phosphate acyltransferase [Tepidisphaeraceae bacterium]
MQRIVIDKSYVPVLPYRGEMWARMLAHVVPLVLERKFGITRVEITGAELLRESLAAGHGIMLAVNHSRDCDPIVLGTLCREVSQPFYMMASWHVFEQSWWEAFLLRRAGAFSVYREGMDRGAVNTAVEILTRAARPLVIFPEGVVSRANDRLNALMDGSALIARTAAKRRQKEFDRKVVVHPVAIRYEFHGDINSALSPALDEIEHRLTWRSSAELPIAERIAHIGPALLALKEIEYMGQAQNGTIADRLKNLIDHILKPIEMEWTKGDSSGSVVARVKRIRLAIVPDLVVGEIEEKERARRWDQLADVYLAQQLSNYPPDYIAGNPKPERLMETVERFEEDMTDRVRVYPPMSAKISVGPTIEVSPTRERGEGDSLMLEIEQQLKSMLHITTQPTQ